jgi:hypothetical protein
VFGRALGGLLGRVVAWFTGSGVERAPARISEQQQIRDIESALRRTLANTRLYGPGHPLVEEQVHALYAQLRLRVAVHGDLTLRIEPGAIDLSDAVFEALFADGIASITFHGALTEPTLRRYVALWHESASSVDDPEHSFATRAWQAELPGISTRLRFAFGEYTGTAADELTRHYERLMDTVRSVAAERGGGVERLDRFLPGGEGSGEAARRGVELAEPELNGLSAAVASATRGAGQRVLLRLWTEFAVVEGGEALLGLAAAVIDGLAQAGRTDELVRAFTRITASARGDASAEARLERFSLSLGNQKVVGTLVTQLANPVAEAGAMFLLRELPSTFTEQIVAACRAAPPESWAKLAPVLAAKQVPAHQLGLWILLVDAPLGRVLLDVAAAKTPHHLDAALRVALLADDTGLRRAALAHIEPRTAERYRSLLEGCAEHPDLAVRGIALERLEDLADRHLVPLLAKQLADPSASMSIAGVAVRGLRRAGGAAAVEALAVALERGRSRGIQLQAIEALGELGDADAQRALRVVADRWLTPRAIRRAARAALARRDARRSA